MNYLVNHLYFGELCALSAALCWSIAVIIFKSASKTISPILITALKNSIALIFFIIFFIILDIPFWYDGLEIIDYIKIFISGCLGMGLSDVLFIYALSIVGANRVAIINCFEPAVIYFFSILILGTILTLQQFIGFVIVIISLLIISYEKDSDDINPKIKKQGMLIQICAVIISSFSIVLIKPILSKTDSIVIQVWITVFRLLPGFIVAWIIFLFQTNKVKSLLAIKKSFIGLKLLISSGLGTFIALMFWIIGYANIEKPPVASIIGQTAVIFIIILSFIFLKEKISKLRIISIFIALSGVFLITLK